MTNPMAVRTGGSGNFDLVRFKNGLNAEVIDSIAGSPGVTGDHRLNRAVQLCDRVLWIANDNAYQKDGNAASVLKLSALSGSDANAGWLKYYMHPTNGPGAFGCTHEFSGEMIKYDYKTDAWSKINIGSNSGTNNFGRQSLCVINNVGYFSNGNFIYEVDPVAETITQSANLGAPMALCPYNDILYVLKANTVNGSPYELGQFLGGAFVKLTDVTNSQTSTGSSDDEITLPLIYQIGNLTYVACNNNTTSDGWVAGTWDGTTYTEVTGTLLPAALQPGGSLAGNGADRWRAFPWKVQQGDVTRTFIQFSLGNTTTSSLLYEHSGSVWVPRNTSQHGNQFCQMSNNEAGGDLYYDSTELSSIRLSEATKVANGMELEFNVCGDAGTPDTFCALWYSADGGGTWTRATLATPPSTPTGGSSTIVLNNLQNVDADGDSVSPTTYTIVHNWSVDGLSSTDGVWWQLRCGKSQFT